MFGQLARASAGGPQMGSRSRRRNTKAVEIKLLGETLVLLTNLLHSVVSVTTSTPPRRRAYPRSMALPAWAGADQQSQDCVHERSLP
jgi:hypothetical protein